MAHIQLLLDSEESLNSIDYKKIIEKHPWIIQKNQKCVISPDSDGFLCGLFLSHFLNWEVVGYYDTKVMVLDKNYVPKDVIFLDVEICRKEIRSFGHHMLLFKNKYFEIVKDGFANCIQPNLMRKYDSRTFRLKYPLATIHLLIGIYDNTVSRINIKESAICPLLFTDGTFNVLFSYPENVLNWLKYMNAQDAASALYQLFENDNYSVISLMREMDDFFRKRDAVSVAKERGDRMRISSKDGSPYNIEKDGIDYFINSSAVDRIIRFIKINSDLIGWEYKSESWKWKNLRLYKFSKKDFVGSQKTITNKSFEELLSKRPLSWAMTSGNNIEYTLEEPDKMV